MSESSSFNPSHRISHFHSHATNRPSQGAREILSNVGSGFFSLALNKNTNRHSSIFFLYHNGSSHMTHFGDQYFICKGNFVLPFYFKMHRKTYPKEHYKNPYDGLKNGQRNRKYIFLKKTRR